MKTKASSDALAARGRYMKRLSGLKKERSSWDRRNMELAHYIAPTRARFFQTDTNRGNKKHGHIINNTASLAARVAQAGMMSGFTNPARPWFRMTTEDPELAEYGTVKEYLSKVTDIALLTMLKSNIYKELHELYGSLFVFGTGVNILDEDPKNLMHAYTVPVGEFCLATSDNGTVDTLYRETSLSVRSLVDQFGYDKCSGKVQSLYDRSDYDTMIQVARVIEPRRARDTSKVDGKNMPWASCWFEQGNDVTTGLLEESGYNESPILAPRWDVLANDTYGTSPGMDALADVKSLQRYELDSALASEKIVDPPMGGPGILRNRKVSFLPGKFTAYDAPNNKVEPLQVVPPTAVEILDRKITRLEQRIDKTLYADLFLMISEDDREQPMTAREVVERREEKLQQLGPVTFRLQTELAKPVVERTVAICARAGKLPPKPPELKGKQVSIEYLSIMSQAQKAAAAGTIKDVVGFAIDIAEQRPEILDVLNLDNVLRGYGNDVGLPPEMLNDPDKVAQVRNGRAKAAQAQAQSQQALAAAQVGKTLSQANTSGDNALTRSLGPIATAGMQGGN